MLVLLKTCQLSLLISFTQSHQKPMVNPIIVLPTCSGSSTLQSPAPIITPTTTLISDLDLMRCTLHIHDNVSHLAGYLGITSTSLEEIKSEYREVETQAYWVLKKWQENNTSNAHQDYLHNVLQTLGFHKAAERYLCLLDI